jgi:hypothetical protein
VRLDVISPFGVTLSTLTSDGERFAFFDLREKKFSHGVANDCNVRRFLNVPVPPHALVRLLSGEAPVLVHEPPDASIRWQGRYVIDIRSRHGARERIQLEPRPDDWELPYERQRLRVLEVEVEQRGVVLYRVELDDHRPARTAVARVDELGIEPDVPPSGPACDAEIPRRIRFVTPVSGQDVLFSHESIVHNPPLIEGLFRQAAPGGVAIRHSTCEGP